MRRFTSLILFTLALPCIYFGGAGAAFYYHMHAVSGVSDLNRLPLAPLPQSKTRLLVFAPHCDDETLGCAGLIQQTWAAGGEVRVVMLTNGDGFRAAVQREMRDLRVGPQDYIRFAALRQEESYQALSHLGVDRKNVLFFGYPDRGLMQIWNQNWTPDLPYTSAYTQKTTSPYPNTFHKQARYCGQEILNDIRMVMRDFRPTEITVTHPLDDHPDHAAGSAFVTRALQELQSDPQASSWAHKVGLHYYLVHRGDWPLPQGHHVGNPLTPPPAMARLDTRWTKLPMTADETDRKTESIHLYPSQTALSERFLTSFARQNELFGELPITRLTNVSNGTISVDAQTQDWEQIPPMLMHPVSDNVMRDLEGGGDLRTLYACRDHSRLYLRLDTRLPVSSRVRFTLHVRAFGSDGSSEAQAFTMRCSLNDAGKERADGVRIAVKDRLLEAAIPWSYLQRSPRSGTLQALAISVDTDMAGVEIDKSGIRLLTL